MKSAILCTCFFSALLVLLAGAQEPKICGNVVCQENQYCYSPYPAVNACYEYRHYGQQCYQRGLHLCAPGLECVVPHGVSGTCRYATTTAAAAPGGLSDENDHPLMKALLQL